MAMAWHQALSCEFVSAEAWVCSCLRPCGICGGQSDSGTGFYLSELQFLPVSIIPPCCSPLHHVACSYIFVSKMFLPELSPFVGLANTVGSRFVTVRFTMIHFHDPCPGGPGTPNLWSITVTTQVSFLYLVHC